MKLQIGTVFACILALAASIPAPTYEDFIEKAWQHLQESSVQKIDEFLHENSAYLNFPIVEWLQEVAEKNEIKELLANNYLDLTNVVANRDVELLKQLLRVYEETNPYYEVFPSSRVADAYVSCVTDGNNPEICGLFEEFMLKTSESFGWERYLKSLSTEIMSNLADNNQGEALNHFLRLGIVDPADLAKEFVKQRRAQAPITDVLRRYVDMRLVVIPRDRRFQF